MKKLILIAAMCLVMLLPGVNAEPSPPDFYQSTNAAVPTIVAVGQQNWYIFYPTEIPGPGTYPVSGSMSFTAAVGAAVSVLPSASTLVGCTIGAITQSTSGQSIAFFFPITVTDDDCIASIRLTFQTTTGVSLSNIQIGLQINVHDLRVDIADDSTNDGSLTENWADVSPDAKTEFRDAISIFLPLLFFVLVVIWAEINREGFLYLFAVILGSILIPLLWVDIANSLRTFLVMVIAFMALRLYNSATEERETN